MTAAAGLSRPAAPSPGRRRGVLRLRRPWQRQCKGADPAPRDRIQPSPDRICGGRPYCGEGRRVFRRLLRAAEGRSSGLSGGLASDEAPAAPRRESPSGRGCAMVARSWPWHDAVVARSLLAHGVWRGAAAVRAYCVWASGGWFRSCGGCMRRRAMGSRPSVGGAACVARGGLQRSGGSTVLCLAPDGGVSRPW
jgi:hypothetical protein